MVTGSSSPTREKDELRPTRDAKEAKEDRTLRRKKKGINKRSEKRKLGETVLILSRGDLSRIHRTLFCSGYTPCGGDEDKEGKEGHPPWLKRR